MLRALSMTLICGTAVMALSQSDLHFWRDPGSIVFPACGRRLRER
jgi:hypothetical protein